MKEIIQQSSPNIEENQTKEFLLKTNPRHLSPSQLKLRKKYKRRSLYVLTHKKIIQELTDNENKLLVSLPKKLTVNEKIKRKRLKKNQRYRFNKDLICI